MTSLPRVFLALAAMGLCSITPAATPSPAAAEPLSEEQKAFLHALDADLARLDALLAQIHEPLHKATTKAYIDRFKETRAALAQKFDQAKYDEVKFETQFEAQRIHRWLAPLEARPPNPATDTTNHVVYILEPNPGDAAEVKASITALDAEIARLLRRNQQRAGGASRDAEKKRLDTMPARRAELGNNFSSAGWTALLGELKALAEERDDTIWPPKSHPLHPTSP